MSLTLLSKNMIKKIDEIPEYGPFEKVCEFLNTDTLSGQYVDKFALEIYNMPENIQPDQGKRYIEVSANGKDKP